MKIMIFGGTGFLGKRLALLLSGEHSVTVLTRSLNKIFPTGQHDISFVVGDLISGDYPCLEDYDTIINCSGEIHDVTLMYRLHVAAVEKAIDSLSAAAKTHWIQVSSVGVYGRQRHGVVRENESFNPTGPYEVSKADGEKLVKARCTDKKIPFTIIRPSNVFANDMPNQALVKLIRSVMNKTFFFIGSPENVVMNYVHVDDVCHAIKLCVLDRRAVGEDYIISDSMPIVDFIHLIKYELGGGMVLTLPESFARFAAHTFKYIKAWPLTHGRIDALTTRALYSNDKIECQLGYSPVMGVRSGLTSFCRSSRI